MILRIIAFARQSSSFLDTDAFRDLYDTKLGHWYRRLLQKGFYWEAYRFLSILLPMFTWAEYSDFHDLPDAFETLPEYSEDVFLTELARCRLLGSYLLKYSGTEALLTANHYFERAETLAKTILANEADHIQSRPVLVWMMQKESLLAYEISQKGLLATSSNYLELWYGEGRTRFRGIFTGQELLGRGVVLAGTSSAEGEGDSLLRVIEQAANRSGDYRVLAECLRGSIRRQTFPEAQKQLEKLMDLQLKTMVDINGYLESLISKYYLIHGAGLTAVRHLEDVLYKQFVEFHRSFRILWDPYTLNGIDKIVFFEIPLTTWTARRVVSFLSESLGRKEESALQMAQAIRLLGALPQSSKYDEAEEIVEREIRLSNPRRRRMWALIMEEPPPRRRIKIESRTSSSKSLVDE